MLLSLLFFTTRVRNLSFFFFFLSLRLLDLRMLHQPAWLQHLIVSYLCLSDSFKANHAVSEWCQGFLLRQATGPNVLLLQAMECMYTYPACLKRVILTARSPVSYIGHMQYESSASRKWSISSCHGLLLTDGVVEAPPYEQGITVYPRSSTELLLLTTTPLRPTASPAPQPCHSTPIYRHFSA